ncbi:hypothetical protein M9H77_14911 [Catharanthus roseus]|uniref:Uncharacterized protein n=1 Tax=Catharanthus roseus TaxID=4058 RepID=A0ACC0BPP1_CATRO|nr:hypothetical protein M9H77_14911 [Catharanthus roseus]
MGIFSPDHHHYTKTISDQLVASSEEEEEEEQIVDDFFNVDCFEKDNKNVAQLQEDEYDHHRLTFPDGDHFQDQHHLENFSISSHVFGGDHSLMLVDEMDELESFQDLEAISDHHMVPAAVVEQVSQGNRVDQGLNLVHLLLACAEAVGCRDTHLADSILNQIWPSVSPLGDSLLRVSYCFAMGLKSRLSLLQNVNPNGTLFALNGAGDLSLVSREEKLEAFRLLHQATPYISFGFMAANDAICQAARGKEFLHIVDLGSGSHHHLQWPSLIRNLTSRTEGPPKQVRITSIIEDQDPIPDLEANMKGAIEEASSLGVILEFHIITGPVTPLLLTKEKLELREGDALFVNSIMHLHKFVKESRGTLKSILQAIKRLSPILITVVEQDANHNGPFFLGRFLESLHYYSAIFDSMEAILPRDSTHRVKIEKFHFAEEIRNIVAYEGSDRIQRHERAYQWRRQLGRAGFQAVELKSMSQVRMMLSVYGCDGYTLATEKGCLLLGWKGRPIMLASAWQVNNAA